MPFLRVIKPGFQTTVQDLGRPRFAHFGVSASGAADAVSLRIGNILVGNKERAAGLEMTLVGGEIEFEAAAIVAVTGSNFEPTLDGKPIPLWTSFQVRAGQFIRMSATKDGARCYVAVRGGFNIPAVLGSVSTHLGTGIGGYNGRSLRKGDLLEYGLLPVDSFSPITFDAKSIVNLSHPRTLRVTEGPQADSFREDAQHLFATSSYRVSEDSNRMGVRLTGPPLARINDEDIVTEGVSLGAIQVSHDGQPIILFVEHQTTGGYPKIANVICADLHKVGQLRPRDEVRFEFVSFEQAESSMEELESHINNNVLVRQ